MSIWALFDRLRREASTERLAELTLKSQPRASAERLRMTFAKQVQQVSLKCVPVGDGQEIGPSG